MVGAPVQRGHVRDLVRMLLSSLLTVLPLAAFAGYDDGARFAFIGSQQQKAIFVVDLRDRSRAEMLSLDLAPDSVAASAALKALIVGHASEQQLTLVDLTSDVLAQIDYPLEISPDTVLVSPIGETVAVFDNDRAMIQVHAIKRRQVLVTAKNVKTITDLTFSPDGSIVYWVDQASGTLNSIDLWSEHKQLQLARENSALSAMTRSVDGSLGFVSDATSAAIHIVDLHEFRLLRTGLIGQTPARPWGTADGRYMLVPDSGNGTVTAISTLSTEFIYTVDAVADPVSINPGWIDTVAAIVGRDGTVVFINIDNGAELARAKLDGVPEAGIVTSD